MSYVPRSHWRSEPLSTIGTYVSGMVLLVLSACVSLFPHTWITSLVWTFDPMGKGSVVKAIGKDITMSIVIFSILFSVILLCALWFHDIWYPPEGRAERKRWGHALDRAEGRNKHSSQEVALPQPSPEGKEAESAFPLFR